MSNYIRTHNSKFDVVFVSCNEIINLLILTKSLSVVLLLLNQEKWCGAPPLSSGAPPLSVEIRNKIICNITRYSDKSVWIIHSKGGKNKKYGTYDNFVVLSFFQGIQAMKKTRQILRNNLFLILTCTINIFQIGSITKLHFCSKSIF